MAGALHFNDRCTRAQSEPGQVLILAAVRLRKMEHSAHTVVVMSTLRVNCRRPNIQTTSSAILCIKQPLSGQPMPIRPQSSKPDWSMNTTSRGDDDAVHGETANVYKPARGSWHIQAHAHDRTCMCNQIHKTANMLKSSMQPKHVQHAVCQCCSSAQSRLSFSVNHLNHTIPATTEVRNFKASITSTPAKLWCADGIAQLPLTLPMQRVTRDVGGHRPTGTTECQASKARLLP